MLSDNIKNYRKKSNMSQDELAEKLGISRQSISLWETGQTQPTIDNIIALAKIFNVSSDMLLGTSDSINISQDKTPVDTVPADKVPTDKVPTDKIPIKKRPTGLILTIIIAATVIMGAVILAVFLRGNLFEKNDSDNETANNSIVQAENSSGNNTSNDIASENGNINTSKEPNSENANNSSDSSKVPDNNSNNSNVDNETSTPVDAQNVNINTPKVPHSENVNDNSNTSKVSGKDSNISNVDEEPNIPVDIQNVNDNSDASEVSGNNSNNSNVDNETSAPVDVPFDLFSYCKNFAIQKGTLNGDYCIYRQPATMYGGYDNEYFSIRYWSGSNMVEFCLHCPLSETFSINFYLRMRGGYNKKYEYLSSKYYRDTGDSLRCVSGYIDPAVFFDGYPISWDEYEGSFDGQDEFMEESRVGICDLIRCLKEFVKVENMECDFSDFDFVNF